MTESDGTPPDPGALIQMMNGYWQSAAIKGALDLDLFTHVGTGADTESQLADRANVPERSARILADAMCALQLLAKENGHYVLTPTSDTFLRSDRPESFLGGFYRFQLSEPLWNAFGRITEAARKGGTVIDHHALTPENSLWQVFAEASAPMARGTADPLPDLVGTSRSGLRILDVAAGSGEYGLALARSVPDAEVTFLDWPNVLEVSRRHAEAAGLASRAHYISGDALHLDWGGPYDVVVAGHFLHHFDRQQCVHICNKAHDALVEGGVFATCEFVADEERKEPGMPLLFAVAMLVWTESGDAYTFRELESFLREAGFADATHHPMPDGPASWIIARR